MESISSSDSRTHLRYSVNHRRVTGTGTALNNTPPVQRTQIPGESSSISSLSSPATRKSSSTCFDYLDRYKSGTKLQVYASPSTETNGQDEDEDGTESSATVRKHGTTLSNYLYKNSISQPSGKVVRASSPGMRNPDKRFENRNRFGFARSSSRKVTPPRSQDVALKVAMENNGSLSRFATSGIQDPNPVPYCSPSSSTKSSVSPATSITSLISQPDPEPEDVEEITNAFMFRAPALAQVAPAVPATPRPNPLEKSNSSEMITVKVSRIHSQDAPALRKAVLQKKLSLNDPQETMRFREHSGSRRGSLPTLHDVTQASRGSSLSLTTLQRANSDSAQDLREGNSPKPSTPTTPSSMTEEPSGLQPTDTVSYQSSEEFCVKEDIGMTINAEVKEMDSSSFFHSEEQETPTKIEISTHIQALAQFLVDSVNDKSALENMETIRSDNFDLLKEDFQSLDVRLHEAFRAITLPDDWFILGPYPEDVDRETLFHFAARLGLYEVSSYFLEQASSAKALSVKNLSGLLASEVALNSRHTDLADLLDPQPDEAPVDPEDSLEGENAEINSITSRSMEQTNITQNGLEAEFDKLHQLIAEIENDCRSSSSPKEEILKPLLAQTDKPEITTPGSILSIQTTLTSIPEGEPLSSIPPTTDSPDSTGVPASTLRPFSRLSDQSPTSEDQEVSELTQNSSQQEGDIVTRQGVEAASMREEDYTSPDEEDDEDTNPSDISDTIELARKTREQVEAMQKSHMEADRASRMDSLQRFSTSCPSLEAQEIFEQQTSVGYVPQFRPSKAGQYKSLLDVTKEEDEEEVRAAINESPKSRPRSLDLSTFGCQLSIAGVTTSVSTDYAERLEETAERHRKVSFNMFGGGAQREKTKFHQGIVSAENRSVSLGSLESEEDENDTSPLREREKSSESLGHVKPIDIHQAPHPLQKLPNVDFSKHIKQNNSISSTSSNSSEKIDRTSVSTKLSHSRSGLPIPGTEPVSNLSKLRSVSTPSINQIGKDSSNKRDTQSTYGSRLHGTKTGTLDARKSARPLSGDTPSTGPSSIHDEEYKKNKKATRKSSVFSKLPSVRGKNKNKDKSDTKKAAHNFVSVQVGNLPCHYCHKMIMSRTPAVQCSYCLTNYHDECKDKVPSCSKQKDRERKIPVVHSTSSLGNFQSSRGEMNEFNSIGDTNSVSMESLIDDADDEYEEDPELTAGPEAETWSETMDKRVLKGLKPKSILRQDNIWELIATERQYLLNLKIMQKVFVNGFRQECNLMESDIQSMFPELAELIDLHTQFQNMLVDRQSKKADRSVDFLGDIVIKQFSGTSGERMKAAYGVFCSRHKEAISRYKELVRTSKPMAIFIRKTHNMPCTKRKGVQDFVTVVTMRMTKYRTMLENIIKNTKENKDKADKDSLGKGLELNKRILEHIDQAIHLRNQELKQLEIFSKVDARSTVVYDKVKKFSKSDIMANSRKLRYNGALMWRNARDKEVEIVAVVLSDVVVFLQESDKKYTFFSQDNKASVIPLQSLIVREKGTKDNRGIYLIRQSRANPEMYELVCKSSQDRKDWIENLRRAVAECPEEDEGVINESEEEHKEVIAKIAQLREYVELLDCKDQDLENFCRERFGILSELMKIYEHQDVVKHIKSYYDEDGEIFSASRLIQMALDEAAHLASLYQTTPSTNLGRSWSSVGERSSPHYQPFPLPKRAETFNGFDGSEVKSPLSQKTVLDKQDSADGAPGTLSLLSVHQDSDNEALERSDAKHETSKSAIGRRSSTNIIQNILSSNLAPRTDDADSGRDSLITLSNMASITSMIPPTREQAHSITQLTEYLHGILLVTNKQNSMLERAKVELVDHKVRSKKMEIDQEKKSELRHNKQMEEIRNRHQQLTEERNRLEAEKETLHAKSEQQYQEMEALRNEIEEQQIELRKEKEEIQRQKEALQKQIDFYKMRGGRRADSSGRSPSLSPHLTPNGSSTDISATQADGTENGSPSGHRRSHSAELIDMVPSDLFLDPRYTASLTEPLNMKEARAQHLASQNMSPERQISPLAAVTVSDRLNSHGSLKKSHNNNTVQHLPSKLLNSSQSSLKTTKNLPSKNVLPLNLAETPSKKSGKAQTPGSGGKGDVIYF